MVQFAWQKRAAGVPLLGRRWPVSLRWEDDRVRVALPTIPEAFEAGSFRETRASRVVLALALEAPMAFSKKKPRLQPRETKISSFFLA